jgi:hypothetical protein
VIRLVAACARKVLQRIGVAPESTESFDLAAGRPVRREIGNVLLRDRRVQAGGAGRLRPLRLMIA